MDEFRAPEFSQEFKAVLFLGTVCHIRAVIQDCLNVYVKKLISITPPSLKHKQI